jgi:hypothetical protein
MGDFGNDGLRWVFGRHPKSKRPKFFENTTHTQHTRGGGGQFSRNFGTETRRHYKSTILNTSERSNNEQTWLSQSNGNYQSIIQEYGRQQQSCQQAKAKAKAKAQAKAQAKAKAKASKRQQQQAKATREANSLGPATSNPGIRRRKEERKHSQGGESTRRAHTRAL